MNDHTGQEDVSFGLDDIYCSQERRRFLKRLAVGAAAAAVGIQRLPKAEAAQNEPKLIESAPGEMPTIKIGKYTLSRMVVGNNPLDGISHSSRNLSDHMREYFTVERITEFLMRCDKLGLNAWQSEYKDKIHRALQNIREQGSKMQAMYLSADHPRARPLKEQLPTKPIAIVHHGGVTDRLFRLNRHEKVHDYLKQIKDAGVMAGVSAHNPDCIKYIEEKGWEVDFYMCCCYQVTRPGEQIKAKLGTVPLGEPFLAGDRDEMTAVVKQIDKPCLLFKILAAGRLCGSDREVENAFKYAFANIKKTDGIIVGMYPRFKDEIGENVKLTLKYGKPA
ncbi:MAG: twin-arginine translocation signal domain-containing protein [Planctomycetota bacterium]|nr:MAG: twin-arginine translocation signal domain-containing protein [Planctomycetota bacterium]